MNKITHFPANENKMIVDMLEYLIDEGIVALGDLKELGGEK